MKTYNVGIVGCGGISRWAHYPFYKNDKRVKVVAVCDIIKERAEGFVRDCYPEAAVYTDYRDLVSREDIDCVDICTPNYLHSEIAVAAFAHGKNVFSEKPDAVSPEKAIAMKEAAEKAGKLLMVMRNNRFADASAYMKKYIEAGRMGEIYAGRCAWQRRRGIPGKGGWFTTKAQSGGGPLIDLGVHMIDLAVWLMGNPTPVAVSGNTFCKFASNDVSDSVNSNFGDKKAGGTFDVEDLAMGMIRFDNGAVLQIEFSWASNVKEEHRFVELRGTKAGMLWLDGNTLEIYSEDDGQLTNTKMAGNLRDDGHVRNLRHFYDVLDGKCEPCFKPQQGVDMIKILSAVYESAKTGQEVKL
ncbi:MAG: Gfo/Idh/MocA family oxidoreductase [Victivallales bacterium]|nr:Gfo/Idh/MocA family oxidoreductase [Victivallales bacterium]